MRNIMFTGNVEPWEGARLEQQRLGSSPIGKDAARDELFGSRRPSKFNEVVRAGRSVTDVMPFVDLDSPLSMLDANRTMAERALEIALKAGPKNDGTFAGLLKSPRVTDARHVSDNSIAPFNDGTPIGDARAVAASISNGRYNTTQTRIRPGCAAPITENYTVYDPRHYHPPPGQMATDVSCGLRLRVPTHPSKAGAEARWDTTEYRRHPTDLRPASIDPWAATVGRPIGEESELAVPRRPEYRRRNTDLSTEGRDNGAGDGWGERRHPHDLSYAPPPLRPPPMISAQMVVQPVVPNHRSEAPWPQHARRPILCSDVTSHSDEANRTRNAARSRRQREMHGLAPAVPLQLHEDSLYGHGLHTTGLQGGYGDRYSEVARGTGGSFTEVERTGPWVARKPGEVERRPDLARKTSFELGSDFSRAFQSDLSREANGPVHGRQSSSMHGPTSMRRPGLWAKLQESASTPDMYVGGMSAAAAADTTRGGEKELQRARDTLKAKIHDKFRTALTAFRSIDTDHSGTLSYDEIVTAVKIATPPSDATPPSPSRVRAPSQPRTAAAAALSLLPRCQVRHFNLPVSDMYIRQLCEAADTNGDGDVDYDEFARAVEQMVGHGDLIDFTGRETLEDIQGGVKRNEEQNERMLGSNAENYQRQYAHQEAHGRAHQVADF